MWQRLARSELLSTFFPTWIWQGREWSKWRIPKYDPYYWLVADAHPVVSTYYPFSVLFSLIFRVCNIDGRFLAYLLLLLSHVVWGFFGWLNCINYWSTTTCALLGAITFTFSGYNWKQQPCFQYTVAWFPWLLLGIAKHSILLSGISFGMILLAGYYPIGIQIALVAGCATLYWNCPPYWIPIGIIIGLPQLIPFLKYLPKTIRANKHDSIGKVPWWHFIHLVFPGATRWSVNGVGFWEMSYYVGIITLLTIWYTTSVALALIGISLILMLGTLEKYLPRIPARWSYTFQFGLIWSAISGLNNLHLSDKTLAILCLIQAYDLIHNNLPLLITRPYSELPQKPSRAFNTRLTRYLEAHLGQYRVSGLPYPLFTGHINQLRTLGYSGGMQLKLMAKWRNDTNPNGSGEHDWFRRNEDSDLLRRYNVKYAFTSQRIDWKRTPISKLWANPSL